MTRTLRIVHCMIPADADQNCPKCGDMLFPAAYGERRHPEADAPGANCAVKCGGCGAVFPAYGEAGYGDDGEGYRWRRVEPARLLCDTPNCPRPATTATGKGDWCEECDALPRCASCRQPTAEPLSLHRGWCPECVAACDGTEHQLAARFGTAGGHP